MHEVSLAHSLIELSCQEASGQRILSVHLRLGLKSCVAEEALRFCFEVVSRGTLAEGARLEIESTPGSDLQLVSLEVE